MFCSDEGYAHPMLHGTAKSSLPLPQPESEMEVADTPYYYSYDQKENLPPAGSTAAPDTPHLRFEITSDDGFYTAAYNCHGG